MSTFDFGAAAETGEAFNATGSRLPKGNYIGVVNVENTSSNRGDPMLKVVFENDEGMSYDNLVVIATNQYVELMFSKVLALIDACGVPRPDASKGEIDPATGRLSDEYAAKLDKKRVGVLIRDEQETENRPDNPKFGQTITVPRINGRYVPVSKLNGNTGAIESNANGTTKPSSPVDDDIPF